MFFLTLAFKIDEKAFSHEHYLSILVTFLGKTEHFSGETKAVEILVTVRRKIYYLSHP